MIYHSKQITCKFLHLSSIALLCLYLGNIAYADINDEGPFLLGQDYYFAGDYDAAISIFSEATATSPDNSTYHHWLGRSYGQLAKKSGIFRAYNLSHKTREALERAVELDQENTEALADLMKFYEQAPAFLGGGQEKAEEIRNRLEKLESRSGQPEPDNIEG
jgi:tetratricopeptide (TPR) repeat protein